MEDFRSIDIYCNFYYKLFFCYFNFVKTVPKMIIFITVLCFDLILQCCKIFHSLVSVAVSQYIIIHPLDLHHLTNRSPASLTKYETASYIVFCFRLDIIYFSRILFSTKCKFCLFWPTFVVTKPLNSHPIAWTFPLFLCFVCYLVPSMHLPLVLENYCLPNQLFPQKEKKKKTRTI